MKEVSRQEFYAEIGPMDVHPHPTGDWPYLVLWKLRNRTVVGKSQGSRYWLPNRKERA